MTTPVEPVSAAVTTSASVVAVVLWSLNAAQAAAIVSAAVAVIGLLVNIWAARETQRRQQEQHVLIMERLRGAKTYEPDGG